MIEPHHPAVPSGEPARARARFLDRTVIVTGAGSGIGQATALRLAAEGASVIAVDISLPRLDELLSISDTGGIVTVAADITDEADIGRIIDAAGSRVDGLANVAGVMDDMTPVGEVTDAVWRRVFSVNVDGTMRLMRAVIPLMLEHGNGSIVNVTSEAALRGSAAGAAYTASKHAVAGLTVSSAYMYGPSGVRVNAVAPGPVRTNIETSWGSELGRERIRTSYPIIPRRVEPHVITAPIAFLLSDDSANINGAVIPSDGGWSAA